MSATNAQALKRSRASKADAVLSDMTNAGDLLPSQARTFIRRMRDKPVMMRQARVIPMASPDHRIPKIVFTGRISQPGTAGTALTQSQRSKATYAAVNMSAEKYIAEVRMPSEMFEDNIEGQALQNTVLTLMAEAVGRDIEYEAIQGDTASATPLLAVQDGLLKLATSNTYAHGAAAPDQDLFLQANMAMPTQYRQERGLLRHFTSSDAAELWRDVVSDRQTALGDKHFVDEVPVLRGGGIAVEGIGSDLWPSTQGVGSNETSMLTTNPMNLLYGIWRRITVKTYEDISSDEMVFVVTYRIAFDYEEEEAVVKSTGILNA